MRIDSQNAGVYRLSVRLKLFTLAGLLGGLSISACDCGDGGLTKQNQDGGMGRCAGDEDCPDREACNVSIGICYPLDECDKDRPCPQDDQVCEDRNGDGYLQCVFTRCTDDDECTAIQCMNGLVPACVSGGCTCGEPCNGGCPSNQGCCIPTEVCHDLPEQCMGLECPPGQFVSVTSSGAWDRGQCEFLGEACECATLPPLPEGDIGLYSALAHDGLGGVMSAYNLDYGDLMFGIVQADGTLNWEFIDGLPTSTDSITGDVLGPRGGNSAPGPDVGIYTDVAADSTGRPHVAYQDRDRGALKYATRTAMGWRNHTVEGEGTGDTGLYASIIVDGMDRPVIAYLSAREIGPGGNRRSVLRLAVASTQEPSGPGDWAFRDLETVDLSGFGCADRCNVDEVCLQATQACVVPDPAGTCNPSCGSGTRCIGGTCQNISSLPPFRDLPTASGLWPAMAQMPDSGVMIAFYDRMTGQLKMARIAGADLLGGALTVRTIDGNGAPNGSMDDAGLFPSLYVTPGGEIHVTYMNATQQAVWYRNLDEQLNTLIAEEIESGLDMGGGPDGTLIGADSAVVVDADGVVRVAYQDATRGDLRYARRDASASWTIFTLAGDENPYQGSFGFYADHVLDSDRRAPMVSSYRYFLSAPTGPDNGVEVFSPP